MTSLHVVPSPHLGFCACNTASFWSQNYKSLWVPDFAWSICAWEYSAIRTRITNLHGSQTSPVVLCLQNNVISIRITSLYGCQLSSVVFACKTATFGSELHVSMVPRLRLRFFPFKTAPLVTRIASLYLYSALICWFLHSKQRHLATETLVSMGPRPHLSFCACNTEPD